MALCKQTRTYEMFAWSGATSPEDIITVTLASGAKIVFRGIEEEIGGIASPAFKLDTAASNKVSVRRLYESAARQFYHKQSRWWRLRHLAMRNPEWFKQHVEFAIQPRGFDFGIDQTQDLVVGCGLYVHFIMENRVVTIPEIFPYILVYGDTSTTMRISPGLSHGSSTIINIE